MKNWLEKYNDSKVTTGPGFVGQGYDTTGRNYSPAWGGQFEDGGKPVPHKPTVAEISQMPDRSVRKDSNLENLFEIVDPTGISSWDDIYRSYKETGMSPQTALEIFGAMPMMGKLGKVGKYAEVLSKAFAVTGRQKRNAKAVSETLKAVGKYGPSVGRASDAYQANEQWDEFAMGGSIPGAVGFTYARTQDPAPSNGKYAKKTLASAQGGKDLSKNDNIPSTSSARNKVISDEIAKKAIAKKRIDAAQNTSEEFIQDWMNSPMYKQMLSNSAQGSEFEKINKGRQQNLQTLIDDPNVFNITDLNEDNDYIDNLIGHKLLGEAGLTKSGKFKINLDKETAANKNLANEVAVHEVSHTTDFNDNIPSSDIAKMQSYKKASDKAKSKTSIPVIDNSEFNDYLAKPTETRARLNALRYLGKEKGIYDPFTEKINKNNLHKFNSIFSKDKSLTQLREIYSDDQIIDMLNSVSKNDNGMMTPQAQNGKEMSFYQNGLDWKPKSISKNGSELPVAAFGDYFQDSGQASVGKGVGSFIGNLIAPGIGGQIGGQLGKVAGNLLGGVDDANRLAGYQAGFKRNLDETGYAQGAQAIHSQISSFAENGSAIKDDRGQWAHPGEITEINSPYITMEGVPYEVIGISDTGDKKTMKPGKNYKFKGTKVTEFPKGGWLEKYNK